jgi:polyisoprenoid-binding protein YceI
LTANLFESYVILASGLADDILQPYIEQYNPERIVTVSPFKGLIICKVSIPNSTELHTHIHTKPPVNIPTVVKEDTMKTKHPLSIYKITLLIVLLTVFWAPVSFAESYKLDPVHTSIIFRVKHLGVAYVFGRFNGATGTFSFDESLPSNSSIQMQINTNNIDTNEEKRDNHLRSPDFFNAAVYPLITFKSTSVKNIDKDNLQVLGYLTILGKTRPITVKVRHTGSGKDPWGNFRSGFETSFSIKRSDFGMDFMLGGVSDEVNLTVSVEGIRQ